MGFRARLSKIGSADVTIARMKIGIGWIVVAGALSRRVRVLGPEPERVMLVGVVTLL